VHSRRPRVRTARTPAASRSRSFPSDFGDFPTGTRVELAVCGRGGSPKCANFRQALASPHSGSSIHDLAAAVEFKREGAGIMTKRLIAAVACAVVTAACATGASIGQVKTNPGRYVDRSVTVRGTVTSSWGIPLVPLKMYQVDDGTGEILVVSDDRRIPSKGAQVKVTGKISEFAVLGGRSIGLHLRESDLDYSGR